MSIHAWRQADCLSISKNYSEHLNFFEPSIHNYISEGGRSGKTAGEFPILYFFIGWIWSIFGESIAFYRLFGLIIYIIGIVYLKKTIFRLTKSHFWSVTVSLFLFCSPVLLYYSLSFLPNIYAFSLVLIGWYHLVSFLADKSDRHLGFFFLFFLVAGLLKITALISLIALIGALLVYSLSKRKIEASFIKVWVGSLAIFGLIGLWFHWVENYNTIHGGKFTFNSVWPFWEMPKESISRAIRFGKEIIYVQMLNRTTWSIIWVIFLVLIISFRKIPAKVSGLIFLLVGIILYSILWFNAFDGHDYYVINLMIFPVAIIIVFLRVFRKRLDLGPFQNSLKATAMLFLVYNILYVSTNMRVRFHDKLFNDRLTQTFFMSQYEQDFWRGMEWSSHQIDHLPNMVNYNRSIGIEKTDLIIYLPDPSYNISLYLLDQKGWTSISNTLTKEGIQEKVDLGAKYLFIHHKHEFDHGYLRPFLSDKIGEFEGTEVFKLQ